MSFEDEWLKLLFFDLFIHIHIYIRYQILTPPIHIG